MTRALVLLALVAVAVTGCVYTKTNISQSKNGVYKDYPTSVEAEQQRRKSRRKWALIASPIEIAAGVGIVAAALFANSSPPSADGGVVDHLGEAGKEIAGRVLLASIGAGAILGGFGDLALGLTDPLRKSPYIRDGKLVQSHEVDHISPLRAPRVDLHFGTGIGTGGASADMGFGLAHWVSDRVRLRHAVSGDFRNNWASERQGGFTVETNAAIAFGRVSGGTRPKKSVGVYAGTGVWWTAEGPAPTAVGGVSFDIGYGQMRLGSRYVVGVDRIPSIDLVTRLEIGGD